MKVALGDVAGIPEHGVKTVEFFGREVLLMRVDGEPLAVVNTCVHLGGPLERDGDRLVCGWHQATYDLRGNRTGGPARPGSRLMILPTRVEDGVLHYVYGPSTDD